VLLPPRHRRPDTADAAAAALAKPIGLAAGASSSPPSRPSSTGRSRIGQRLHERGWTAGQAAA
jgi:hypothetical protein